MRNNTEEVLGTIPYQRCGGTPGTYDEFAPAPGNGENQTGRLEFDQLSGQFLTLVDSSCYTFSGSGYYDLCTYGYRYPTWNGLGERRVFAIEGFTTLFDVIDSYVPTSSTFGFRVPHRPEALRAADRFDTYWGQVTTPLDLSQAHPLQCAYPDHQPQVGEYLSFPDAAPTPEPGEAVYYLTSVTYQSQTRAGRKAIDGRLSGRNATQLPDCVTEPEAAR